MRAEPSTSHVVRRSRLTRYVVSALLFVLFAEAVGQLVFRLHLIELIWPLSASNPLTRAFQTGTFQLQCLMAAGAGALLLAPFSAAMHVVSLSRSAVKRLAAPEARQALQDSPRAPILYLRSFADERRVEDEEMELAQVFEKIGPFVAVGRPGEMLPSLGAARMYLPDDGWQREVEKLLSSSSLVLILAGATPGLGWELKRCRELVSPRKIVILIPTEPDYLKAFAEHLLQNARIDITDVIIGIEEQRLSHFKGKLIGAIVFDDNWCARLVTPGYEHLAMAQSVTPEELFFAAIERAFPTQGGTTAIDERRRISRHLIEIVAKVLAATGQISGATQQLEARRTN